MTQRYSSCLAVLFLIASLFGLMAPTAWSAVPLLPLPEMTSADTLVFQWGRPVNFQILATHSPTLFGFTRDGSPMVPGLTLNPNTGLISGTPVGGPDFGTFQPPLEIQNSSGKTHELLFIYVTSGPPPAIPNPGRASGVVGTPFTFQATGSNNPNWFGAANLPPGLSIDSGTGLISGTPAVAGVYSVTLSERNAWDPSSTNSDIIKITIYANANYPVITSPLVADAPQGIPFTYRITATNNPTSFGAANLPNGLSLNSATGVISGTPDYGGQGSPIPYTVTLTCTNTSGTVTATLHLRKADLKITSPLYAVAEAGAPFSYTIAAVSQSGSAIASYSAGVVPGQTPPLPAWLSLNTSTGVLSGTPPAAGTLMIQILAKAANSAYAYEVLEIFIGPAQVKPPVISSALSAAGALGVPFSYQISATNNPILFAAYGLPPGLSVDATTGQISGAPQAPGAFLVRIALQRLKKGLTEAGLAAAAPRVTADLAHEAALLDRPCSPELVGRLTRQALEMPAWIHRGPRLARALPRKAQPQRLWLAVASVLGLAAAASILLGFRATTAAPAGLTGAPERTPDAKIARPAGSEQRRPFSKTFEFNRPAFPSEMRLLKGSWTWIPKAGPDGSGCMETGEEVSLVAFYFPRLLPPAKVTYSQLPRASKFLLNLPYVVYSDEGASRSFRSGTWGGFSYVFPSLKWPDSNLPSERAWAGPSSQTFEQIPTSPCNVNGCRGLILRIHTNAKFRFDNLTVQGMEDCAGAEYPFAEERIKSLVMNAHKMTEVQVLSEFLPCGP